MRIRNVGKIDRIARLLSAAFLCWTGLVLLEGLEGDFFGILLVLFSMIPFYMAATASCFVFRYFKIHSLDAQECKMFGHPPKTNDSKPTSKPRH